MFVFQYCLNGVIKATVVFISLKIGQISRLNYLTSLKYDTQKYMDPVDLYKKNIRIIC